MPAISTNLAANTALRYLNMNAAQQSDTLARISSGKRIVRASDDAAGLAVSNRITADVSTLEQAAVNGAQGISVLQTADGGLAKIGDVLQRMKTLVAQSLSGAVTDKERAYINLEFVELKKEVDAIAKSTKFNGDSLLQGTSAWVGAGVDFLLGTDVVADVLNVKLDKADLTTLGVAAADTIETQAKAKTTSPKIDAAIEKISAARAKTGSYISRFKFRSANIAQSYENLKAANSKITDADIAVEQTNFSSQQVLTNAAINALSKANQIPQQLMSLFR